MPLPWRWRHQILLFLPVIMLLSAGCAPKVVEVDREIAVDVVQFEFRPPTITVNQGERIRLILTSLDVTHGLGILEYGINQQVPAGQTVNLIFTADQAGTFPIFCTVFCGTDHAAHKGALIVVP